MGWFRVASTALLCLLAASAGAQDVDRRVKAGFLVTSLSRISSTDGSFDVSGYAWLIDRGAITDATDEIQILARRALIEPVQSVALDDGATFTALRFEATVDQVFDLRDYPFDRQTLRLNVETKLPADRLRFVPDEVDTRLADFLVVAGWKVTGLRLLESIVGYDTSLGVWSAPDFSRLTLLIDMERERSNFVIGKFIGYTMALLVTALIFFVPPDQIGVRIGMATTAVFAAVGNRYGLDTVIGAESAFGLVDQLSIIVLRQHLQRDRRNAADLRPG